MDKIAHFSVYGLLATLVLRVVFQPSRKVVGIAVSIAIVSLYGVSDEFHQGFTPGRSVELADWVADTFGASVAVLSYSFWPAYRRWLESGVSRRTALGGRVGVPHVVASEAVVAEGARK